MRKPAGPGPLVTTTRNPAMLRVSISLNMVLLLMIAMRRSIFIIKLHLKRDYDTVVS
jgi:hypothetical protein